jgi:2,4-dienoyl-CoA reductase-like NADH-dependent reductase (Old Yellow Enzyme family)
VALSRVFSPLVIKNVELPNRIVRTAHGTSFGSEITDALIDYHVARAKGGCALSIIEAAGVHRSSSILLHGFDDRLIQGQRRMMAAVKPYGMKMFQQLWHAGNLYPQIDGAPPWGVSTIPGPVTGAVPTPMTDEQIEEVIEAFAAAAVRCREGGMDGVEIHAAHGYLFHQFLSLLTNNRTDRWGGSIDNRMRPLIETLRAVRKAVGDDFVVGIRVSASQAVGGLSEENIRQVIGSVEAEGLIDYLNASWGDYYRMETMNACMQVPTGYELPSSGRLTEVSSVPRIVAGRFRTLEDAEQVLRAGVADMVSMVRAQIADPDLVRKMREGHAQEVRPCIACNQGCIGGYFRSGRMGCVVNPAVGFEALWSEDLLGSASAARKKVLVVGGGPAGLEAARAAAVAGHSVVLVEASEKLGGAINVARLAPRMHTIGDIVYWLEQEVYRLGVEVRLATYFEAAEVLAEHADVVVIATGSMPRMDGRQTSTPGEVPPGVELPHVLSSTDLLTTPRLDIGRSALVLDDTGGFEAAVAAEALAAKGLQLTYVTRFSSFAPLVQNSLRTTPILDEGLYQSEFSLFTYHCLVAIRPGECDIRSLHGTKIRTVPAETVVLVTPNEPLRGLYDDLCTQHADVRLIGDARSPRDLQDAIADGRHLAFAIAGG